MQGWRKIISIGGGRGGTEEIVDRSHGFEATVRGRVREGDVPPPV